MFYTVLFTIFLVLFLYDLIQRKEHAEVAFVMGLSLFVLVAFRSSSVGPDTFNYISLFYTGVYGNDFREMESVFLLWNSFWRGLYFNGQMYLIVCAIASVGSVIYVIWKSSRQRVWSYTLFLVSFAWYFYLSGIRQGLAMGCFTMGVYLLNKNIDLLSFSLPNNSSTSNKQISGVKRFFMKLANAFRPLFSLKNLTAFLFIFMAPLFHTTALYAIAILFVSLAFGGNRVFYILAILLTFVLAVTGIFKSAEQLLDRAFSLFTGDMSIASRYETYLDDEYSYGTGLYLVLKDCLPINCVALLALYLRNRQYRLKERLFFWLVITHNLFFYFSYMFRMNMFLYPFACIAIANLISPVLKKKQFGLLHVAFALYVVLSAYVEWRNLTAMPEFNYEFFI